MPARTATPTPVSDALRLAHLMLSVRMLGMIWTDLGKFPALRAVFADRGPEPRRPPRRTWW